jgi:hypothetical protein
VQVVEDSEFPDLEAATIIGKLFAEKIIYEVHRDQPRPPADKPTGEAGSRLERWLSEANAPAGTRGHITPQGGMPAVEDENEDEGDDADDAVNGLGAAHAEDDAEEVDDGAIAPASNGLGAHEFDGAPTQVERPPGRAPERPMGRESTMRGVGPQAQAVSSVVAATDARTSGRRTVRERPPAALAGVTPAEAALSGAIESPGPAAVAPPPVSAPQLRSARVMTPARLTQTSPVADEDVEEQDEEQEQEQEQEQEEDGLHGHEAYARPHTRTAPGYESSEGEEPEQEDLGTMVAPAPRHAALIPPAPPARRSANVTPTGRARSGAHLSAVGHEPVAVAGPASGRVSAAGPSSAPPSSASQPMPSFVRTDDALPAYGGEEDWQQPRRQTRIGVMIALGVVLGGVVTLLIYKGLSSKEPPPPPAPVAEPAPPPAPPPPAPVAAAPAPAPAAAVPGTAVPVPPPPGAAPVAAAAPPVELPAPAPAAAPAAAAPAAAIPPVDPAREACRTAHAGKKYKEIVAACTKVLQANPAAADAMVILANAELEKGNMAKTLEWSKKAIAADANVAEAYAFIGTVEQERGHAAQARDAYQRYLELAPDGPYAADFKAILPTLK